MTLIDNNAGGDLAEIKETFGYSSQRDGIYNVSRAKLSSAGVKASSEDDASDCRQSECDHHDCEPNACGPN
ncbi:MAG: hypothetical protein V1844_17050 [Pseudomonadota bacterium]